MRLNKRENHTQILFSLNGKSREQVHLHRRSKTIQHNIRSNLFGGSNIPRLAHHLVAQVVGFYQGVAVSSLV
jgi:hypothetical protein